MRQSKGTVMTRCRQCESDEPTRWYCADCLDDIVDDLITKAILARDIAVLNADNPDLLEKLVIRNDDYDNVILGVCTPDSWATVKKLGIKMPKGWEP